MKVYIATTQGLKYDHMVISETEEKAWQQLRKWWNKTWAKEDGEKNFDDATDWYGFYARSIPISLDVPFDIRN
tara:strand:- start:345 stop:563 length:219 start_codon:yes stop_codon:yes gene_type:complete